MHCSCTMLCSFTPHAATLTRPTAAGSLSLSAHSAAPPFAACFLDQARGQPCSMNGFAISCMSAAMRADPGRRSAWLHEGVRDLFHAATGCHQHDSCPPAHLQGPGKRRRTASEGAEWQFDAAMQAAVQDVSGQCQKRGTESATTHYEAEEPRLVCHSQGVLWVCARLTTAAEQQFQRFNMAARRQDGTARTHAQQQCEKDRGEGAPLRYSFVSSSTRFSSGS